MSRTIKDATVKAFHYDNLASLQAHVLAFLTAYNFPANEARISIEFDCGARMTVTGAVDPMLAAAMAKALAQR